MNNQIIPPPLLTPIMSLQPKDSENGISYLLYQQKYFKLKKRRELFNIINKPIYVFSVHNTIQDVLYTRAQKTRFIHFIAYFRWCCSATTAAAAFTH